MTNIPESCNCILRGLSRRGSTPRHCLLAEFLQVQARDRHNVRRLAKASANNDVRI